MERRTDPVQKSIAVTPNDSTDLSDSGATVKCRAISVTVAGVIAFKDANDVTRLTSSLAAGTLHPISTKRVMATGTTATGIVAYW